MNVSKCLNACNLLINDDLNKGLWQGIYRLAFLSARVSRYTIAVFLPTPNDLITLLIGDQ
jgi:hypothetical protein